MERDDRRRTNLRSRGIGAVNPSGLPTSEDRDGVRRMMVHTGQMGWGDVGAWIQMLLMDQAGFDADDAVSLTSQIVQMADADVAIGAATAALASERAPGASDWWRAEGEPLRQRMLEGIALRQLDPDGQIGEAIEPAPDEWDPTGRTRSAFWAVPIPEGAESGCTFVVGSGWGMRGRFVVVDRDGRQGVQLLESWDVTAGEREQATEMFQRLLALGGD